MNRREKILGNLNITDLKGIEIGPLAWPLIQKSDGDVIYVDFADAESLRKNYKSHKHVPIENIVEVDAIWGQSTLFEAIGNQFVDYVVASHVIEHVPDLLGWLSELRAVLKDSGEIRLAIPDKRYCFDFLRNETVLSDVLSAHLIKARVPQPRQILDFLLSYIDVNKEKAWSNPEELYSLKNSTSISSAMKVANSALEGIYTDVHCWVFTPNSFANLFVKLAEGGLIDFECIKFYDTHPGEYEFFIVMKPSSGIENVTKSWESMVRLTRNSPNVNSTGTFDINNFLEYEGKIIKQPAANRGKDDGWYLVRGGKKTWIVDSSWLGNNGYHISDVKEVSTIVFNAIPEDRGFLN